MVVWGVAGMYVGMIERLEILRVNWLMYDLRGICDRLWKVENSK
jgi:hypothetical protein